MTLEQRKATFQLIKKPRPALPFEDRSFDTPSQATLFPMEEPDLLIFLYFPFVTAEEFTRTLELARPAAVLKLRRSRASTSATSTASRSFASSTRSIPPITTWAPWNPLRTGMPPTLYNWSVLSCALPALRQKVPS